MILAYASAVKSEPALTRHWLNKYSKTHAFDMMLMQSHPALDQYRQEQWFDRILKSRMH